jgi:hypothetical protein
MGHEFAAHDPSALVKRGHLPFAESAKGRKKKEAAHLNPSPRATMPRRTWVVPPWMV